MDIADLVSNVGFPIALCFYFIYNQNKMQQQYKEDLQQLHKQHLEEMSMFATAIDNNTKAIEQWERSIKEWQKKE